MVRILSYGGGVDSTAILALILAGEMPAPDAVLFADPGAEFPATYATVALARQRCQAAGIRFETVRHERDTIQTWLSRNGNLPVMPGGPHVCSLKFKGEVMQRWAEREFPGQAITWLIGIEADEEHRTKRFTPPREGPHRFSYPLKDAGLIRADCVEVLRRLWRAPVRKSCCVFCPFMTRPEIAALIDTDDWQTARDIEQLFRTTSARKHRAWLDAGRPMNGSRAPAGMWRKDAWAEGARLFAARHNGRQLSVDEWEHEVRDPAQPSLF